MTGKKKKYNRETILLHAGYDPRDAFGAQAVPIIQSTSFRFKNSDHAASLFESNEAGNIYTRISNPTTDVLEKRIAELEGGKGAVAFASGLAAISSSILSITKAGDEVISSQSLYGGTHNLFRYTLKKFGITTHFVPINEFEKIKPLINEKTRAIFTESIGNPSLIISDIEGLKDILRKYNIPLIVDNTFSPYIFQPFHFGADIIVYSATKYIGGHGNSMGGLIVDSGKFDWSKGKYPGISEPDPEFHGMIFSEKFKNVSASTPYIMKARLTMLRDLGGSPSPFNSFLLLQGVETLYIRMKEHIKNAKKITVFLKEHPKVSWVNFPGSGSKENDILANKYFPKGAGAVIGFGIKGGKESGKKFIDSLGLIAHLANIGDTRTLAIHPASTTHQRLTAKERLEAGVTEDFIRLSVGIENPNDIISDLDQALKKVNGGE